MHTRLFYVLVFMVSSDAFAQINQVVPVQFNQFFKTYSLLNPASIGTKSDLEINTGDKILTGVFRGVRTYYVNVNYKLDSKKLDSDKSLVKHVAGLVFINDKEGIYFSRSRASMKYAIHIPVSTNITLNGGASFGFVNHAYKASNLGGGGSAFAPTSDAGIWMYGKDFNIGFSANQIFAGKLTPLQQTVTLQRHFNIVGEKIIRLDPYFSLMPALLVRYIDKENQNIDLAMMGILQEMLSVGLSYKYHKGISFIGGIEKIPFGKNYLKFMFSYYTFFNRSNAYNPQTLEFSLNFIHGKQS